MVTTMSDITSDLAKVNRPPVKFQPPKGQKEALAHKVKIVNLFVQSGVIRIAGSITMLHQILRFVMCAWWLNLRRNY